MRNFFQPQNKPVQKHQSTFGDPWMASEAKTIPKPKLIQLEQHLLESDPSLAHAAIAPAGSPGAKTLGGASSVAMLHPVKVLLSDELKVKTAFESSLWEHTRNAVALMIWFHSPTYG